MMMDLLTVLKKEESRLLAASGKIGAKLSQIKAAINAMSSNVHKPFAARVSKLRKMGALCWKFVSTSLSTSKVKNERIAGCWREKVFTPIVYPRRFGTVGHFVYEACFEVC
jgi:hypothetical protein